MHTHTRTYIKYAPSTRTAMFARFVFRVMRRIAFREYRDYVRYVYVQQHVLRVSLFIAEHIRKNMSITIYILYADGAVDECIYSGLGQMSV